MPRARISALNVYPVKSCRGIGLADGARRRARARRGDPGGRASGDREWMIVDPRRALRHAARVSAARARSARASTPARSSSRRPAGAARGAARRRTAARRARSSCGTAAFPPSTRATPPPRWLSSVLGADVRLVRFDPRTSACAIRRYAGDSGAHTAFADGYPVLVIGEASLADLNGRLAASGSPALPMNRFRPNIVLPGLEPFDEDHIDTLVAGGVDDEARQAVHALPDHDHRPGLRGGRRRAAGDAAAATGWTSAWAASRSA